MTAQRRHVGSRLAAIRRTAPRLSALRGLRRRGLGRRGLGRWRGVRRRVHGLRAPARRVAAPPAAWLGRWWPHLALVAACALAGLGYTAAAGDTYTARAYVAVVPRDAGGAAAAVGFAQAYARIALGAEAEPSLRVSSSPDSAIVEVAASAGDPAGAASAANQVADDLIRTGTANADKTRMSLVLLSAAAPPAAPTSARAGLGTVVGAAVGVLLAGIWLALGGRRPEPPQSPGSPQTPETLQSSETPQSSGSPHVLEAAVPATPADGAGATRGDQADTVEIPVATRGPGGPGQGDGASDGAADGRHVIVWPDAGGRTGPIRSGSP